MSGWEEDVEHDEDCGCETCTGVLQAKPWDWLCLVESGLKFSWRVSKAAAEVSEDVLDDFLRHRTFLAERDSLFGQVQQFLGGSDG